MLKAILKTISQLKKPCKVLKYACTHVSFEGSRGIKIKASEGNNRMASLAISLENQKNLMSRTIKKKVEKFAFKCASPSKLNYSRSQKPQIKLKNVWGEKNPIFHHRNIFFASVIHIRGWWPVITKDLEGNFLKKRKVTRHHRNI